MNGGIFYNISILFFLWKYIQRKKVNWRLIKEKEKLENWEIMQQMREAKLEKREVLYVRINLVLAIQEMIAINVPINQEQSKAKEVLQDEIMRNSIIVEDELIVVSTGACKPLEDKTWVLLLVKQVFLLPFREKIQLGKPATLVR